MEWFGAAWLWLEAVGGLHTQTQVATAFEQHVGQLTAVILAVFGIAVVVAFLWPVKRKD